MKPPAVAASIARQERSAWEWGDGRGIPVWGGVKGAHGAELGGGWGLLECLKGPFWCHEYF